MDFSVKRESKSINLRLKSSMDRTSANLHNTVRNRYSRALSKVVSKKIDFILGLDSMGLKRFLSCD
jgi:hypothetical protein